MNVFIHSFDKMLQTLNTCSCMWHCWPTKTGKLLRRKLVHTKGLSKPTSGAGLRSEFDLRGDGSYSDMEFTKMILKLHILQQYVALK